MTRGHTLALTPRHHFTLNRLRTADVQWRASARLTSRLRHLTRAAVAEDEPFYLQPQPA